MAKLRDERFVFPSGLTSDTVTCLDIIMTKQLSNGACHSILFKLIMAILRHESSEALRRRYWHLTKKYCLYIAICWKWKKHFHLFCYFCIQPICFASELFPVLSAHAWFRCSDYNSAVLVGRWARRWRFGSRKGFRTSYPKFAFLVLQFIWTRAHILQIDKDQAELAHANFGILRKEDQPILNLVGNFEILLLPFCTFLFFFFFYIFCYLFS